MRCKDEIFPEGVVYPGHPNVIAVIIMSVFPSIEEAFSKEGQYPAALSDSRIPGAGGNVHAAMDVLKLLNQFGPQVAFERGNDEWSRCVGPKSGNDEKAFAPGQEQADRARQLFFELAEDWYEPMRLAKQARQEIDNRTPPVNSSAIRTRM